MSNNHIKSLGLNVEICKWVSFYCRTYKFGQIYSYEFVRYRLVSEINGPWTAIMVATCLGVTIIDSTSPSHHTV